MSKQGVGRYFVFIKNNVSSDWKDLAWCLGFATPDIDNIDGKRRDDKSRCMELLQEWHKRRGNTATIHVLMEALKDAQLQLVVDSLTGEYPELNEKSKAPTSSSEQEVIWKSEAMPSPMLMVISETSRTSDSQTHNPVLLARVKHELTNKDLSIEEMKKIWKLKEELKACQLDTIYKHQEKQVETLQKAQAFLSPHSLETMFREIWTKVEEENAKIVQMYKDCLILFLIFETKSNFEHFWGLHVSGRLSDKLSEVVRTEEMRRFGGGEQKLVRTLVLEEDYIAWRDFFQQDETGKTSAVPSVVHPTSSMLPTISSSTVLHRADTQPRPSTSSDKPTDFSVLLRDNKRKTPQHDEADRPKKHLKTNTARSETPVTEGTQLPSLSTDLPVHLHLSVVQPPTTAGKQAGNIDVRISEQLLELERTLFTKDVLGDHRLYKQMQVILMPYKALLKGAAVTGLFPLLLTFLRQTDMDQFFHNHYRVGEGTLSQQLSHILISDDLQDKVKGAQLIVRLHVKHEDYVQVRDRMGQGLDRTTSVDNLMALPPTSRHVDCSSLIRGLDLAVIGREDQLCTHRTDDITMPYRQVQSAVQTAREKSKQEVKVQLETMQEQVQTGRIGVDAMMREVKMLREKNEKADKILLDQKTETNEKIQQLHEINKNMEAKIEQLLTAKQPVEGGSQQKDPVHTMDKATNTAKDPKTNVTWVKKVSFGGSGSGRGEFICPYGVVVSQDNEVYIADYSNRRIQVCTMNGVYIREFTTTLSGEKLKPHDVAVDRNDNLWVVSGNHVVQYSREGTCLVKIDLPLVSSLHGITVSMATGQVIVTVTEHGGWNGRLRVFNQDGSEVGTYGSGHRSPKPWWPCYVTVDGEGNILVTDYRNHCVHVLDREGNFKFGIEGSYQRQFIYPKGICVDGMGNIIVADHANGCVQMFDCQGRFLCFIGSDMKGPSGVTVSPGGDVLVTDDISHTVAVWTQD